MKKFSWLLGCLISFHVSAQFSQQTVQVGNMGLNVTNAGTIGLPNVRNNPQGPPSMEYPINSGIEHLFEGGLWIGAQVNGNIAVSTASLDDASGYATGKGGFEFSPKIGSNVTTRSSLTNSNYFSTAAISHQDYLLHFTDAYTVVPGTQTPIQDHTLPLNADVRLETYAWNYAYADFFVLANYTIKNNSGFRWDSVYIGFWSDLVVRNVNVSTDRGAAFFSKGSVGYEDSLKAVYAYDINGDVGFTNSYGAIQFLGGSWRNKFFHPNNSTTFVNQGFPSPQVVPQYWVYNTQAPTNDVLRYDRMKTLGNFNDPTLVAPGNRVQLLSTGPWVSIDPGETVTFTIAFVAAKMVDDNSIPGNKNTVLARTKLRENLGWAKRTYLGEDTNENGVLDPGEDLDFDGILDRFILPEPPLTPKVKVMPEANRVRIYWTGNSENSIDPITKKKDFEGFRLYKTKPGDEFTLDLLAKAELVASWDKPGNSVGFNNGFSAIKLDQPVKFEGDTNTYLYRYDADNLLNGWQYLFLLTAFDEGDDQLKLPPLESSLISNAVRTFVGTTANTTNLKVGVYPNPYVVNAAWDGASSRSKRIQFYNLPAKAQIRIYTLAGEIVATLNHDASAALNGANTGWFQEFGSASQTVMPEGEHSWDVLSDSKQVIATGLYLFSVKDLNSGKIQTGKFAIVK